MKKAVIAIVCVFVMTICSVVLLACNKAKLGDMPNIEIKSQHNYVNGVCSDCGYQADLWDGSVALGFEKGSGTADDPYLISSAAELAYMQKASNNINFSKMYFLLTTNIDLNGREWTPIEDFSGKFDGNGHNISSFKISSRYSDAGLFGGVSGGYICDLAVSNFYIGIKEETKLTSGVMNIGGLAGRASDSTIVRCATTDGVIVVKLNYKRGISLMSSSVDARIGGLVGSGAKKIADCYSDVSLQVETIDNVRTYCGGLIGVMGSEIINCYYKGVMILEDDEPDENWAGGIAGCRSTGGLFSLQYGTISNCFVELHVNTDYNIGAILGDWSGEGIDNCLVVESSSVSLDDNVISQDDYRDGSAILFYSLIGTMNLMSEKWEQSVWDFNGEYPQLRSLESVL